MTGQVQAVRLGTLAGVAVHLVVHAANKHLLANANLKGGEGGVVAEGARGGGGGGGAIKLKP